jgi:flagellar biosynthesis/type III secretory pathway M-ring protein FliF/YscJ
MFYDPLRIAINVSFAAMYLLIFIVVFAFFVNDLWKSIFPPEDNEKKSRQPREPDSLDNDLNDPRYPGKEPPGQTARNQASDDDNRKATDLANERVRRIRQKR